VWTHGGNLCIGEVLKRAVRLTFPEGALLADPTGLFNTRLDSKTVRAIDFAEGDLVHEAALQALIIEVNPGVDRRSRAGRPDPAGAAHAGPLGLRAGVRGLRARRLH
jgi:hypothetical protein